MSGCLKILKSLLAFILITGMLFGQSNSNAPAPYNEQSQASYNQNYNIQTQGAGLLQSADSVNMPVTYPQFGNMQFGPANGKKRTEVQSAHDLKGKVEEFIITKNGVFKAKVYAVKSVETGLVHHWFIQVIDENNAFVNISTISMDAYHQSNKDLKLNYMGPVFAMCQEGKYVIGFVDIDKGGKWILDIEIDQFGKKDTVTLEMDVTQC